MFALGVRREKAALSSGASPTRQPLQQAVNNALRRLLVAK
jgi:hypothetical protein